MTWALPPLAAQVPPEAIYQTAHFSIFYETDPASEDTPDLEDADGDGTPDAIARLGLAFEAAWSFEIDDLGYLAPPVDGRYEVHISASPGGGHVRPAPGGEDRSRPSYVVLPPHAIRPERPDIEVFGLAAHEFFHGVQYGYDYLSDRWFQEASASWIETILYGESMLENLTIPSFLLSPELGLTRTGDLREYGAFLFLRFLTERFGGDPSERAGMIKEIWELMADPAAVPSSPHLGSLDAIDQVLEKRGSDLATAWGEFIVWQRQLSRFEDGSSYRVALQNSGWPDFARRDVARADTCRLDLGELPQMASSYGRIRIKESALKTGLLAATGPPDAVGFYILRSKGRAETYPLEFDADGIARAALGDAPFRPRSVVVGLGSTWSPERRFGYSLRDPGAPSPVEVGTPGGASDLLFRTSGGLAGLVTCAGEPAAFADLRLIVTEVFTGAITSIPLVTDDRGRWETRVSPDASSTFAIEVVDGLLPQTTSPTHLVSIHVFLSMEPSSSSIEEGDAVILAGDITPGTGGSTLIAEYRRPERRRWLSGPTVTTDASGHYEVPLVLPAGGLWEVRTRQVEDLDPHRAPGTSIASLIEVRVP